MHSFYLHHLNENELQVLHFYKLCTRKSKQNSGQFENSDLCKTNLTRSLNNVEADEKNY